MELWDLYTFDRRKTGETMTRGQRQPEGRFRQTVHVCLFNKAGEMLIQRRQRFMKGWPGLGDFTAGGSALAGESSQEAAGRELLEELGVDISFAGIRPALSLPFGKGFDDIFTREQELELAALRLQPEEVEAVQWAGEAKVLAMLEEGTFVPYHPGLVMLLFSLRNTRSSHTHPDPTRRNRRDPEDGTDGISRFSSGKSLPFGKEYATIHFVLSRNDGIGRRGGLKIRWANTPCGFESHFRHHRRTLIWIQLGPFFFAPLPGEKVQTIWAFPAFRTRYAVGSASGTSAYLPIFRCESWM